MGRTGVWVSALRNSIIHVIFSEFLQPFPFVWTKRFAPFWIVVFVFVWFRIFGWLGQRVSPFYHLFNMWTWHRHWMRIYPTQVFPFLLPLSLDTITISFSWRCHGCWRKQAWGRTRWSIRKHDRQNVLRIRIPLFLEIWLFWHLIHS